MRSIMRNFVVPACVVALGAVVIFCNVERKRATERKFAEEVKQYQLGANRGDGNAEYSLALMYLRGTGVPQDYAQADYWYQKAAGQNLAKAKYAIGDLYYYGQGLAQSYADALVWYHQAADQGDAYAQNAIGSMYFYGEGVPQNYSEAMTWFRKSADQGHAKAEYDVGYLYSHGLGIPKDREEAKRWYRKAASRGNKEAQWALGLRLSPLRPWIKATYAIGIIGGLLLISGPLSPRRLLHNQIQRQFVFVGLLCLLAAGMSLYTHSEYCLFPSAWAATAYRFAGSFLDGILITLLVTALKPKAGKVLLISSGILFVTMAICSLAIARFDMRVLSAIGWRFFVFTAFPLGMAISAAVLLWRRQKELETDSPGPPADSGEVPDAV